MISLIINSINGTDNAPIRNIKEYLNELLKYPFYRNLSKYNWLAIKIMIMTEKLMKEIQK